MSALEHNVKYEAILHITASLSERYDDWMASLSLQNNYGQSNSEYVQT